ncbi:hypothetical protein A7X57_02140 [Stenotrophomonas maltophilia]|nr:hypothetical protein A7X57_02140 [Stenotrophomonas maltophilia]
MQYARDHQCRRRQQQARTPNACGPGTEEVATLRSRGSVGGPICERLCQCVPEGWEIMHRCPRALQQHARSIDQDQIDMIVQVVGPDLLERERRTVLEYQTILFQYHPVPLWGIDNEAENQRRQRENRCRAQCRKRPKFGCDGKQEYCQWSGSGGNDGVLVIAPEDAYFAADFPRPGGETGAGGG